MKLFIDTAIVDEIREINDIGVICGVTTNPSLIVKSGRDFKEVLIEICNLVDGPISAEVTSLGWEEMVEEALELVKIHRNIVIKVPLTEDGLRATNVLARKGIKVNVTLIFSLSQALLAARAGAAFVSPFLGRLDDIGQEGIVLVEKIAEVFAIHGIRTEIIGASCRNPLHVEQLALAGAHIATIPYGVLKKMFVHQLTDKGLKKFMEDWEGAKK